MKQGTLVIRAAMVVLFLAVAAYFAGSALRELDQPMYTVATYSYTVSDYLEATGLLVREEEVLSGREGAIVDVLPEQGEKVGAGQAVAYLYQDESALERRGEIRALELEREQLVYALQNGDSGMDSAQLESDIFEAMTQLRSSAVRGDLTRLEDQSLSFKSLVLRQGYSVSGGAEAIQAMVESIDAQRQALYAQSAQDTTPVYSAGSGIFSAEADGYEGVLTPGALEGLTPSGLEQLAGQRAAAPAGAVGKLITSSEWYFAANLEEEAAGRLVEGSRVTVRFSRDWSGEVEMTVEQISEPEDGLCAVVLSSTRSLSETSLLRSQTVDIIFASTTGIRVPKRAVRTELRTETGEDGQEVTRQVTGVYTLTGAQAEFKEVEILADDGDYYLVAADISDNPSDQELKSVLRAGDEVIISSEPLFDGKVILEYLS